MKTLALLLLPLALNPAPGADPGGAPGWPPGAIDLVWAWAGADEADAEQAVPGSSELSMEKGARLETEARFTDMTLALEFQVAQGSAGQFELTPVLALQLTAGAGCGAIVGRSMMSATPGRGAGVWQTLFVDVDAPRGEELPGHVTVRLNGELVHDVRRGGTEPAPLALAVESGTIRVRNGWVLDRSTAAGWQPLTGGESPAGGETPAGWTKRGGAADYRIENGAIVGTTRPHQPNTFLCTERDYTDFVLALEFRIHPELNSGVQIRSQSDPDYRDGAVFGYQVEIDPSERGWSAGIYDESRRGWLAPLSPEHPAKAAFRQNAWNHLLVAAEGARMRTWLNSVPAADLEDDMTPAGFIGLQVHGVGAREDPLDVSWRGLAIRELIDSKDDSR